MARLRPRELGEKMALGLVAELGGDPGPEMTNQLSGAGEGESASGSKREV